DGRHLRPDALPTDISGTAVDAADVRVTLDGVTVGSVQAEAGGAGAGAALQPRMTRNPAGEARWSVPFPAGLAPGAHTLTVTQAVDGVTSRPAKVAFIIDPAAVSGGTPAQPPAAEPPATQPPAAEPPAAEPPAKPAGAPVPPSDTSVIVGGTAPDGNSPGNAGLLASTGAGGLLAAAGLGAGALLLGAAFVAFGRLRPVR
ncbi:MAG: trypsin-like serine protease, partial [Arthrobacter sp.]|nr:trypsin-like serine protease [Arthrobacter sp.]